MDIATLVFTIFGALFGGIQAYLTSIPYLAKKESFREISDNLKELPKLKLSRKFTVEGPETERHRQDRIEEILQMLTCGHVILAGLKRKVAARFVSLCACSLGLSGFAYADIGSRFDITSLAERTEYWDVPVIALAMFLPRIATWCLDRIIMQCEWRFIRALMVVEQAYYRTVVEPNLRNFHAKVEECFKPFAKQVDNEMRYMLGKSSDFDPRSLLQKIREWRISRSRPQLPPP